MLEPARGGDAAERPDQCGGGETGIRCRDLQAAALGDCREAGPGSRPGDFDGSFPTELGDGNLGGTCLEPVPELKTAHRAVCGQRVTIDVHVEEELGWA